MALKKAPYWTELYYKVVSSYFWRPQDIGRMAVPGKSRPWSDWKQRLEGQEIPLNHVLDFLFHIAPQSLLDSVVSSLVGRPVTHLQLVESSAGVLDEGVVQPDIIVSNGHNLIFIEMKVDSKSSVDQFVKYAIAAQCIMQQEPGLKTVDLVILGRKPNHRTTWKNASKLGIGDEDSLRAVALRGLNGDDTVWSERGVQRYRKHHLNELAGLHEYVRSMRLRLVDYQPINDALRDFAEQEDTLRRLIAGVLYEFRRRKLVVDEPGHTTSESGL